MVHRQVIAISDGGITIELSVIDRGHGAEFTKANVTCNGETISIYTGFEGVVKLRDMLNEAIASAIEQGLWQQQIESSLQESIYPSTSSAANTLFPKGLKNEEVAISS